MAVRCLVCPCAAAGAEQTMGFCFSGDAHRRRTTFAVAELAGGQLPCKLRRRRPACVSPSFRLMSAPPLMHHASPVRIKLSSAGRRNRAESVCQKRTELDKIETFCRAPSLTINLVGCLSECCRRRRRCVVGGVTLCPALHTERHRPK